VYLTYGQIVIVSAMLDPNGVNPKDRPSVVVTPSDEIQAEGPFTVIAISTLLPGPVPDDHVELPWEPRGHRRTGLRTRCAAVVPWIQTVPADRIVRSIGTVPGRHLELIAAKLAELRDRA
jgi:mRNA-degrading endonuclease toxin of MazEF toxin-antitoxin module